MGIFDLFSGGPKRFVSRKSCDRNLVNQLAMTPQTLAHLRMYDVSPDHRLKLEFFFYTDAPSKAASLAGALGNMQYEVRYGASASKKKNLQTITGWSGPIGMQDTVVLDWTRQMCELGFEHDCEFDGWGTNPRQ